MGYIGLNDSYRAMLRGLVLSDVVLNCKNCENSQDIQKGNTSIETFARLILANGHQVGRIMEIILNKKPGETSSYEDLSKFTLSAYNAGSGCFEHVLILSQKSPTITWDKLKKTLVLTANMGFIMPNQSRSNN